MATDQDPQVSSHLPTQADIISLSTAQEMGGECPEERGMMLKGSWARGANWMCSDHGEVCHGGGAPRERVAAPVVTRNCLMTLNKLISKSTDQALHCCPITLGPPDVTVTGSMSICVPSWDRHWIYRGRLNHGHSGHTSEICVLLPALKFLLKEILSPGTKISPIPKM